MLYLWSYNSAKGVGHRVRILFMTIKFLIIEDNDDCITIYKDLFKSEYELTIIKGLKELDDYLASSDGASFDLVLSDLKLSDGHFLDWVTQKKSTLMEQFPTIIVSSSEDYEILDASFQWGATDYLIKPFRIAELLAKVKKAQRTYVVKSFMETTESIQDELTAIENKIFQFFLKNMGDAVSREVIIKGIWKKVAVSPKTLDVHLSNLRKKLVNSSWIIDNESERGWQLKRRDLKK